MNNNDNKRQSMTQNHMIAEYLERGFSITSL